MSEAVADAPPIVSGRSLKPPAPTTVVVGGAAGIACAVIAILSFVLPYNSGAAVFLLDHGVGSLFSSVYPFTIQNVLHVLTACGLGILFRRWQRGRFERQFLAADLLPTDDYTLLSFDELGRLRRRILPHVASRAFLPVLVDTAILQATNTRSLEQASAAIGSKLDLLSHRLDLEYQSVRYLAWLVPTLGFVGTVVGIAGALAGIDDPQHLDMTRITAGLGVAFYTTIVALVESAILVFVQNVVQRQEELVLNSAADHCLTNLVNRIHLGA